MLIIAIIVFAAVVFISYKIITAIDEIERKATDEAEELTVSNDTEVKSMIGTAVEPEPEIKVMEEKTETPKKSTKGKRSTKKSKKKEEA